jgi:hypothetical protein
LKINKNHVILLIISLLSGYTLFSITTYPDTQARSGYVNRKIYKYSPEKIVHPVNEYEIHFQAITAMDKWHMHIPNYIATWFNISIVNTMDQPRWVTFPDDYFDVYIYQGNELVVKTRSLSQGIIMSEVRFLAPSGRITLFFPWVGGFIIDGSLVSLPVGEYSVSAVIRFDGEEYFVDGFALDVFTRRESSSIVL